MHTGQESIFVTGGALAVKHDLDAIVALLSCPRCGLCSVYLTVITAYWNKVAFIIQSACTVFQYTFRYIP